MALEIYTYVQYTYEQIIAPNETQQSTLDMALALETEYNNLTLDLSAYDPKLIKEIEKKVFEETTTQIGEAKRANKTLVTVEKISKRLKAAYKPPFRKAY